MTWMTRRRFEWVLRSRGTDLAAWPDQEHRAALGLLRRSRAARQTLADFMADDVAPEPDLAALARVQRAVRIGLAPRPAVVRGIGWSALAACAAAGLYLGVGATQTDQTPDLFASAQTASFASLDP